MTLPSAPPARVAAVPILGTVREAWRLIVAFPRQTLLPMFVIEAPVACISAVVTAILYLTVFHGRDVWLPGDPVAGRGGVVFAYFALAAFELLFAQVARGATVLGVAAARAGRRRPLAELLDPAFTRMGGLLALAIVTYAVLFLGILLLITVIGAVIALFAFLRWSLVFEVFMLEEQRVGASLGGSWRMMHRNMLRYLGVLLVSFGLALLPLVGISLLQLAVGGGRDTVVIATAAVTIAQGVLVVPILVFLTAVTTVFYFNIKERPVDRNPAGE